MEWKNPQFLYGILALIIPLIIHLFNFRISKRIYFSNNYLLKRIIQSNKAKNKFRHWLILISRILVYTFLVLAFAGPYFPSSSPVFDSEETIVYLDNSQSMTREVAHGLNGFDIATDQALQLSTIYPRNTSFRLFTNNFTIGSRFPISSSQWDRSISESQLTYKNLQFNDLWIRLINESSPSHKKDLILISDFQRVNMSSILNKGQDSLFNLYVLPIRGKSYRTALVDTVYLENPTLLSAEENRLKVVVSNRGNSSVLDLTVQFILNDIQQASTSIDLEGEESKELSFDLGGQLQKINRGIIRLNDFPVTFDNDFYFSLILVQKVNVLEIKQSTDTSYIERVYFNRSLFNFNSSLVGSINYGSLKSYDIIILNGIERPSESLLSILKEYKNSRGTLVVIPHPQADLKRYQLLTGLKNLKHMEDTLKLETQDLDLSNPFFEGFFENRDAGFTMPWGKPIFEGMGETLALIRFKPRENMLTQINDKGTMYLFNTPLLSAFTNFPQHALMIPFFYKMAFLSMNQERATYHYSGQNLIEINIDSASSQQLVMKGNKGLFIPAQRHVGERYLLEMPAEGLTPGFYELRQGGKLLDVLAFNGNKLESELETLSDEELKTYFSGMNPRVWDMEETKNLARKVNRERQGFQLWKYCLLLSLFFLLVETALIKFFS